MGTCVYACLHKYAHCGPVDPRRIWGFVIRWGLMFAFLCMRTRFLCHGQKAMPTDFSVGMASRHCFMRRIVQGSYRQAHYSTRRIRIHVLDQAITLKSQRLEPKGTCPMTVRPLVRMFETASRLHHTRVGRRCTCTCFDLQVCIFVETSRPFGLQNLGVRAMFWCCEWCMHSWVWQTCGQAVYTIITYTLFSQQKEIAFDSVLLAYSAFCHKAMWLQRIFGRAWQCLCEHAMLTFCPHACGVLGEHFLDY